MEATTSSIAELREMYRRGEVKPEDTLDAAMAHANGNAGKNVYLSQDREWSRSQAKKLCTEDLETQPLWGVPVSLKDCFDLAGFPTSCGSKFYRDELGVAAADSWVAAKLRQAGALITGKTHMQQLAYGITGENRDFGDCLQPRDATLLT